MELWFGNNVYIAIYFKEYSILGRFTATVDNLMSTLLFPERDDQKGQCCFSYIDVSGHLIWKFACMLY